MKIGIDARPLIKKKSGIGIYIEKILKEILLEDMRNTFFLLSDNEIFFECENKNVVKVVYKPWKYIPHTFYYEFSLGHFLESKGIILDVFWGTQQFMPFDLPYECKKVLTVHDLAYKLYPKTVKKEILVMLNLFAGKSLKKADSIIAFPDS